MPIWVLLQPYSLPITVAHQAHITGTSIDGSSEDWKTVSHLLIFHPMRRILPGLFSTSYVLFRFTLTQLLIRPLVVATNIGLLCLQGFILGALYVSHSGNSYLFALVKGWAGASWFQVSHNLIAYLSDILISRLHGLYISRLDKERKRHCYILGVSGSGKSATMESLLYRDIKQGHGIALIEPHGELTYRCLHYDLLSLNQSSQTYKRLVLFDLESQRPTAFNIFNIPLPDEPVERQIRIDEVVSSYMPAFQMAISPEMTENMHAMLRNVFTAVFYLPEPSMADVVQILAPNGMLENKYHRLIDSLPNHILRAYFQQDFFSNTVEKTKAPLRNRLQHLLTQCQLQKSLLAKENALDFDAVLREGKILIVRASKERVGEQTARMIGNLIHQCLYAAALRRNIRRQITPFYCYVDECQNYMSQTVVQGLSEARKFGFHYVLANQYLGQGMSKDQQKALLSCRVKLCGAVNADDANEMAKQMNIEAHKRHLKTLKAGEFYIHKGEHKGHFVKFPRTFTLPTGLVGRKRSSVYMQQPNYTALLRHLTNKPHEPHPPLKSTSTPSNHLRDKAHFIRHIDLSRFNLSLAQSTPTIGNHLPHHR